MKLAEIIDKCRHLRIADEREITDDYVEFIFFSEDTDQWSESIKAFLDDPIKPAGQDPSEDDLQCTKDYGGVAGNQTLFKKDFDNKTVMVMYWPWSNEVYTTMKMIDVSP